MKTVVVHVARCTLEEFADRHGLVMKLNERNIDGSIPWVTANDRWYARFDGAEVKSGCCLCGAFGNGATQADAMLDYAKQISGKLLVIDAFQPYRREIQVPVLTEEPQ